MARTIDAIQAADRPAKNRRSIAKRVIIVILIAPVVYVLAFGCCTKVVSVLVFSPDDTSTFIYISYDESRNAAGYVAFWPLIHTLENTGRVEFVRRLPSERNRVRGRLLILCFLDQF